MFLFPANLYLSELQTYQPEIAALQESVARARVEETDFVRLDAKLFTATPSLSIDYAVMEQTKKAAVIPMDCGWNDAGSWDALWQVGEKDESGNVKVGQSFLLDSQNCYVSCEEGVRIATLGVKDLVIVSTKDCVLVAEKSRSQDVKALVEMVKAQEPALVDRYRQEYRPWGHYDSIDMGDRHQVKRINVKPGARLSLQMHYHRAEHWIVVRGTAHVVRDGETHIITENQSIYIPSGAKHRIENPGRIPLEIIEVQSGSYLGEDDIVRFDDNYGRAKAS
jgi:mannose-1-phosphate guanylyltransferase/mannose-6-phosphate isomerase